VSGSQADNTLSFVHDNDIFNANFGTITDQTKLKQYNNRVITTDANQYVYTIPATNAYKTATAPYTLTVEDVDVYVNAGSGNVTLPTAVGNSGKKYFIKNAIGSSLTLNTTSSQTIDGVTTQTLPTLSWTKVVSNGTNWVVEDTKFPVLGGYASGSGTISATDNVLTAINKLNGNDGLKANLASPTFTGTPLAPTPSSTTITANQIATTNFTGIRMNFITSGTGSATTISFAHGLTGVTSSSFAIAQAKNAASSGISYVTLDATNVNVVYSVAPASGTNNLYYSIEIRP